MRQQHNNKTLKEHLKDNIEANNYTLNNEQKEYCIHSAFVFCKLSNIKGPKMTCNVVDIIMTISQLSLKQVSMAR